MPAYARHTPVGVLQVFAATSPAQIRELVMVPDPIFMIYEHPVTHGLAEERSRHSAMNQDHTRTIPSAGPMDPEQIRPR